MYIFLTVVLLSGSYYLYCQNRSQAGLEKGHLRSCPSSPNCVCSEIPDSTHAIKPFFWPYKDSPMPFLKHIVEAYPRATIIRQDDRYMHAEFRSRVFRFIDDVEFLWVPESGLIHIRSCARCGYSDFGVNRARMETLRSQFMSNLSHRNTPRDK